MDASNLGLERLLIAAADSQRAGRYDVAESLAEQAVELDDASVAAKFLLGVLCARNGKTKRARELLSQVLAAEPQSYEALISLSNLARECGDGAEAVELAQRAVRIRPQEPNSHNNLGRSLLTLRRLDEAAASFERSIALQPRFAPGHHNLGKVRQFQGRDGEAASSFAQAANLAPSLENLLALGHMQLVLCDFEGASACGRYCIERFSDSAAAHLLLCGALIEQKEFDEADRRLRRAIELDPDGREALQFAARQRPLGYIDEANENLRRAIESNPRQVSAYDSLMHNQRVGDRDRPLVNQMRELLASADLSRTEEHSLRFGLGKALEDLGEYDEAMLHYDEANRIAREIKLDGAGFDREAYARRIDAIIETFSAESLVPGTEDSTLPVLIIGMMRSGTTLAEQILSAHPQVGGAGEQLFWSRNASRFFEADPADREAVVAELGAEYVASLMPFADDADRVTDKMPGNYMFAGLVHRAAPNARFIHMRRSPVDTCLSIWTTPNHMPHEGGHDKRDIVYVYRQYLRLMEHWRTVLPGDRFLEIEYEDLVSNREAVTRRMVEFCGLDWDEACLEPEKNRRVVNTPSAWQVRQPVYRSSVERWRKFEPHLGAFRDLLERERK